MYFSAVPGTHAVVFDSISLCCPPRRSGIPRVCFADMMDAIADESRLVSQVSFGADLITKAAAP